MSGRASRCHEPYLEGGSPEAARILEHYTWPRNVQELQEVIARAVRLAAGSTIEPDDIVFDFQVQEDPVLRAALEASFESGHPMTMAEYTAAFVELAEPRYFERLLARSGGDMRKAARASGLEMSELLFMLKKHGL